MEKMHYLEWYTSGEVREAINDYLDISFEQAYRDAKDTLRCRFGNIYLIGEAFRDRL